MYHPFYQFSKLTNKIPFVTDTNLMQILIWVPKWRGMHSLIIGKPISKLL